MGPIFGVLRSRAGELLSVFGSAEREGRLVQRRMSPIMHHALQYIPNCRRVPGTEYSTRDQITQGNREPSAMKLRSVDDERSGHSESVQMGTHKTSPSTVKHSDICT